MNFEFIFVSGEDKGPVSFFCMWIFSFLTPFAEETILFLCLDNHVEDKLTVHVGVLFLGSLFYSVDLYVFISVPILFCLQNMYNIF